MQHAWDGQWMTEGRMGGVGAVGRGRCKEMEQQSILRKVGRTFYTTQISFLGQCKFKNLGRVGSMNRFQF